MGGIPIDDLLRWAEKMESYQQVAMEPAPDLSRKPVFIEEPAFDEMSFIMSLESDFKKEAASILESLNLSHMKAPAQK